MKIKFEIDEKRLCASQIFQVAIKAAQIGQRVMHRELMRVADKFADNALYTNIKKHQMEFLADLLHKTVFSLETEIIPKLENKETEEKDREERLKTARQILEVADRVIKKLES